MKAEEVTKAVYRYYPKNRSYKSVLYQLSKGQIRMRHLKYKALRDKRFKDRLENNLKEIFSRYEVVDWTDLREDTCYAYKILLHANRPILDDDRELMDALGNTRYDLRFYVSILERYY